MHSNKERTQIRVYNTSDIFSYPARNLYAYMHCNEIEKYTCHEFELTKKKCSLLLVNTQEYVCVCVCMLMLVPVSDLIDGKIDRPIASFDTSLLLGLLF
jgi:hypothetical protein